MTKKAEEQALEHLQKTENRFRLLLVIVTLALVVFIAWNVVELRRHLEYTSTQNARQILHEESNIKERHRKFLVCYFTVPFGEIGPSREQFCLKESGL